MNKEWTTVRISKKFLEWVRKKARGEKSFSAIIERITGYAGEK